MTLENIKLFFQPSYFLNPYPGYEVKYLLLLIILFGLSIVLSIVFYVLFRKKKKNKPLARIFGAFSNCFIWGGVIGFILLFFRYEGVAYVSSRAILFLWLVAVFIWVLLTLILGLRGYKKQTKEFKEKQEKEKYFRKKK